MTDQFKETFEAFLRHIDTYDLVPQNWGELVDSAKILKNHYAGWAITSSQAIASEICDSEGVFAARYSHFKDRAETMLLNGQRSEYADCIYLGAKSAYLDKRQGDFSDRDQLIGRMTEALETGGLIMHFALNAMMILQNQKFSKKEPTHRGVTRVLEDVANQMFDSSLGKMRVLPKSSLPKPETVAELVREEIGILPPLIRKAIIDVMTFRPI